MLKLFLLETEKNNYFNTHRKASFVEVFDEREYNNNNIRYLFPEGCKSPKIEVEIPPIQKKDDVIEIPTTFIPTTNPTDIISEEDGVSYDGKICPGTCCEDNRPQIILPYENSNSCNKTITKLYIPIDLSEAGYDGENILELSEETDTAKMLLKLLKIIEKSRAL